MIKSFKSADLDQLRIDLDNALKSVSVKHGIDIKLGVMNYTDIEVSVTMKLKSKDLSIITPQLKFDLQILRLPENTIGQTIAYKNDTYLLTGLNMKKSKFPIEATCTQSNKSVNFSASIIKTLVK